MRTLTSWNADPIRSFKQFLTSEAFAETGRRTRADGTLRLLSAASAKIYVFMFGSFADWMAEQRLSFSTLTQADLERFVNRTVKGKRVLNSKIAYRYLRLLERCYEHLEVTPNPAQQAILAIDRAHMTKDEAGRTLSDEQLERFFAALTAQAPHPGRTSAFAGWKRRRDRAMQVVIALAGLRVSEAVGLLVPEVGRQAALDGSIMLAITPEEKHDTSHEHEVNLPRRGAEELRAWLAEREAMAIPGQFVFPANLSGGRMTRKTVYMQMRATFERAGMDLARSGGRTLRNTFARQQLDKGTQPEELKDVLGLALARSVEDYKLTRVIPDPDSADPESPGADDDNPPLRSSR
ncbi:site-specific integrase [Massilia sp. Dwa41.01b]|uniref:tyrosine-type recombinase/integrase n=1 Tax=Massilia sp. Dwa41.01b TaxID=2709302 RepID=UPI0015FEBF19|nr:site-specific integrase [Massilia sp. Dwa41.01b]QNA89051.1 site-specific integrase [Massilia sp. Dwa41.01b]